MLDWRKDSPVEPVPDSIEPILAWRAWLVTCEDGAWRLESVVHRCTWPTRHELTATCLTTQGKLAKSHFAPFGQCQCGVYGASTLERVGNYLGHGLGPVPRLQAVGVVRLWGRVLVHEHGWRASHAYPTHLWLSRCDVRDDPIANWERVALDLADYRAPIDILERGNPSYVLAALRSWELDCDEPSAPKAA